MLEQAHEQTRTRVYYLFGFIPIWTWREKVHINENPKYALGGKDSE